MRHEQFLAGAAMVTARAGAQDVLYPLAWRRGLRETDRAHQPVSSLSQTETAVTGEGGITTPPSQGCATRTIP